MRSIAPGIPPVIALNRLDARPLYQQICDGFREAIVERRIRGGQRLPSTRALAAQLEISRTPVGRGASRRYRCNLTETGS